MLGLVMLLLLRGIDWGLHLVLESVLIKTLLKRWPWMGWSVGPFVWSDGSLFWTRSLVLVLLVPSVGTCVGASSYSRRWGHIDLLPPLPDGGSETCRLYCSAPGPFQSVQRTDTWGFLVALQGCVRVHVGVDNLNVINHVCRIVAGGRTIWLLPLLSDGDLLRLVQRLVQCRGRCGTLVSKVKGHADEGMVAMGSVKEVDRIGSNGADATADMGRRRLHCSITDARCVVNGGCACCYPIVQELHRLIIVIARTVVNCDLGGTSIHPVVWSNEVNSKRRRVDRAVRNLGWLPGPACLWTSDWFSHACSWYCYC